MAISERETRRFKQVVDTLATPNVFDVDLLSNLSLQDRCSFEILIFPEIDLLLKEGDFLSVATLPFLSSVIKAPLLGRYYLYSIQDIPFVGYEYERNGGYKDVKSTAYPETITLTFLEDSLGTAKSFFQDWSDEIATYNPLTRDYVYNDNQYKSKKTAIIIPTQKTAIPSATWIKIEGMKYSKVSGVSYEHSNGEYELLTVEFSVENIKFMDLI